MPDFLSEANRLDAINETEKSEELAMIISDVPPNTLVNTLISENAKNSFNWEKYQNFFIAQRIAAKAQGIESFHQVPEEIKGLVVSRAVFFNAQYNLVYECWDVLKVKAKREGLILPDGQPKDFYKLLLDTDYIQSFTELDNDTRTDSQRLDAQHKQISRRLKTYEDCKQLNIELENLVPPTYNPDRSRATYRKQLNAYKKQKENLNRRIAAIQRGSNHDYESWGRPYQLLIDTADTLKQKSSVVATAVKYYLNARDDMQRANSEYFSNAYLKTLGK